MENFEKIVADYNATVAKEEIQKAVPFVQRGAIIGIWQDVLGLVCLKLIKNESQMYQKYIYNRGGGGERK